MGRLVVSMFSTLDGVMQGPGGPGEDTEGDFAFSGWQAPFAGHDSGTVIVQQILEQDALLIGRTTYDIWVKHWPRQTDVIGDRFNAIPKYVASRTLTHADWAGTTVISDVPRDVAAIKEAHTETRVWGSSDLLTSLLDADLVDAIDLFVFPIVLGTGKRWFRDGVLPAAFTPTAPARCFEGGSVLLSYARAGVPQFGSMAD